MPEDMGQVGFNAAIFAIVGDVEMGDREIGLEGFVFGVVDCMVGSVVPESSVLVTIVHGSRHIFDGMLSGCEVEIVVGDVEIQSSLLTATVGAVASDFSTLRIETFIQAEAYSLDPSIMQLIIDPHFELDVTVVGEVDELDLEEVPVVKSEVIGVYLLVEVQPRKGRTGFEVGLGESVVL